ncbi:MULTISPECIES: replication initiation protein RepC [Rhodobacterales]|uniref:replication initiation protein RepC n=1 Tax=Rhodobacterales TaxID=204455 RepID=UPI001EEFE0C3|nr:MULTISPECIES: replication initiation protein RepC [Rhodobacterales]
MQTCPEFASRARNTGGFFKDWGDLHRFADQLMLMVGISEHAWNVAQEPMGTQVATVAFALVFEKHGRVRLLRRADICAAWSRRRGQKICTSNATSIADLAVRQR